MAINYAKLTKRVRKLLKENGAVYVVTRPEVVYRDANGVEISEPAHNYDVIGILTKFSLMELTSTTIQGGDMKFICVAPEDMQIGDVVNIGGTRWRVENPAPVKPDGSTRLVNLAQVRIL